MTLLLLIPELPYQMSSRLIQPFWNELYRQNTNNYETHNNLMSYAFFLGEIIPFQSYSEAEF